MNNRIYGTQKKAPCFECAERKEGCHASCERYKAYRAERDSIIEKRKDERRKKNAFWKG